jgi:hypothetical protein
LRNKNNIIEGDPNNPCNLSGNGNNPIPNIGIKNPDFIRLKTYYKY